MNPLVLWNCFWSVSSRSAELSLFACHCRVSSQVSPRPDRSSRPQRGAWSAADDREDQEEPQASPEVKGGGQAVCVCAWCASREPRHGRELAQRVPRPPGVHGTPACDPATVGGQGALSPGSRRGAALSGPGFCRGRHVLSSQTVSGRSLHVLGDVKGWTGLNTHNLGL